LFYNRAQKAWEKNILIFVRYMYAWNTVLWTLRQKKIQNFSIWMCHILKILIPNNLISASNLTRKPSLCESSRFEEQPAKMLMKGREKSFCHRKIYHFIIMFCDRWDYDVFWWNLMCVYLSSPIKEKKKILTVYGFSRIKFWQNTNQKKKKIK
jgi:hypothetical protein